MLYDYNFFRVRGGCLYRLIELAYSKNLFLSPKNTFVAIVFGPSANKSAFIILMSFQSVVSQKNRSKRKRGSGTL